MSIKKNKNNFRNEQGVTLLLAIIILSSVMAISFSLATIMFIEVRTSGDLLKTEGALYAAGGVGEEAFFNIKRATCPLSGEGCPYTTSFSNNVKLSGNPITSSTSTPIIQDKVVVNSPFGSSSQKTYDFCNIATQAGSGCGYGKVEITYLDTGSDNPIMVYLCEFDPEADYQGEVPCSNLYTLLGYWQNPGGTQLTENSNFLSLNLNIARQQVLIITNPSTSGDNVYYQIKTYDTDMVTPKGLPYVGKSAVDINAVNSAVGRKIRVIVPNNSSSASAAVGGSQVFSSPTGGTPFTVPSYGTLTVKVWGAGGGGGADNGVTPGGGSSGGQSNFNGSVIAFGGGGGGNEGTAGGAGGSASGGDTNSTGSAGETALFAVSTVYSGAGGNAAGIGGGVGGARQETIGVGFPGGAPGGGGGGGYAAAGLRHGSGGGGGGYSEKIYLPGQLVVGANVNVVVGTGGNGYSFATGGGKGADGRVEITWTAP